MHSNQRIISSKKERTEPFLCSVNRKGKFEVKKRARMRPIEVKLRVGFDRPMSVANVELFGERTMFFVKPRRYLFSYKTLSNNKQKENRLLHIREGRH